MPRRARRIVKLTRSRPYGHASYPPSSSLTPSRYFLASDPESKFPPGPQWRLIRWMLVNMRASPGSPITLPPSAPASSCSLSPFSIVNSPSYRPRTQHGLTTNPCLPLVTQSPTRHSVFGDHSMFSSTSFLAPPLSTLASPVPSVQVLFSKAPKSRQKRPGPQATPPRIAWPGSECSQDSRLFPSGVLHDSLVLRDPTPLEDFANRAQTFQPPSLSFPDDCSATSAIALELDPIYLPQHRNPDTTWGSDSSVTHIQEPASLEEQLDLLNSINRPQGRYAYIDNSNSTECSISDGSITLYTANSSEVTWTSQPDPQFSSPTPSPCVQFNFIPAAVDLWSNLSDPFCPTSLTQPLFQRSMPIAHGATTHRTSNFHTMSDSTVDASGVVSDSEVSDISIVAPFSDEESTLSHVQPTSSTLSMPGNWIENSPAEEPGWRDILTPKALIAAGVAAGLFAFSSFWC